MSMMLTLIEPSEDPGNEDGLTVPAKYEVCGGCDGKGTHVNPNVDGHGISREEFDEDPDFRESYFRGDYDVRCETCRGERVVLEPDEERLTADQRARLEEFYQDRYAARLERESEMRYGY